MSNGYNGKILRVNLSKNTISEEKLDELFCRRYLGGAGFITYYLMKELKPGIDPLGLDNKLFFMAGPLTGLSFSGSARHCVGAKSPLTGGYAKSESGGYWGSELRHAGYDGVIVEGKADKPVYIWIHEGEASIRDGSHLWGENAKETESTIRTELGDSRIRVALIGTAGENLVRFACIMNDLKDAAGRGGMGAVMGSKNLKAIAVRGSKMPKVANQDGLSTIRQWITDNKALYAGMSEYGTIPPAAMQGGVQIGNIPIRNFRDGDFPITKIDTETLKNTIRIGMEACYACVVRCKKVVEINEPSLTVDPAYGGPEYETLGSLGSTCGVEDLKAIAKGHELCGTYTLDTISTGVVIAFAMECYENGILTNEDTGGIDLRFGNAQAMLQVIGLIARREGIGDILAEGAKRAAQTIGKGSEKFAMTARGMEVPMHDPRAKAALGLGYEVNPIGADHCLNMHDTAYAAVNPSLVALNSFGVLEPLPATDLSPRKVNMFRYLTNYGLVRDSAVVCQIVPFDIDVFVNIVKDVTGWNTGAVELMKIADRIFTLARMYNLREGMSAADDKLPKRLFQQHVGGPSADSTPYEEEKLEKAKSYYYTLMGWDAKTGVPTPETLDALDISWASVK